MKVSRLVHIQEDKPTQEDRRVYGKISADTNGPDRRESGKSYIIVGATGGNTKDGIDKQCRVEGWSKITGSGYEKRPICSHTHRRPQISEPTPQNRAPTSNPIFWPNFRKGPWKRNSFTTGDRIKPVTTYGVVPSEPTPKKSHDNTYGPHVIAFDELRVRPCSRV